MDWETQKQTVIDEVLDHVSNLSNLDPIPLDEIDALNDRLSRMETANQTEWAQEAHHQWWQDYKAKIA